MAFQHLSNADCGTVTLTKEVYGGTPLVSGYSIVPKIQTGLSDPISLGNCEDIAIKLNITSNSYQDVEWERVTTNYTISENSTRYAIFAPTANGYIQFTVRVLNNCGWSSWYYYSINVNSCDDGGFSYSVAPNPTSDKLFIKSKSKTEENRVKLSSNKPVYVLYDFNSNIIMQGDIYDLTELNISRLARGRYILKIKDGEMEESHHILVE